MYSDSTIWKIIIRTRHSLVRHYSAKPISFRRAKVTATRRIPHTPRQRKRPFYTVLRSARFQKALPRTSATATPARYARMFVRGRRHLRFDGRARFGDVRRSGRRGQWRVRWRAGVAGRSEPVPGRARRRPALRSSDRIAPFNRHKHAHLRKVINRP